MNEDTAASRSTDPRSRQVAANIRAEMARQGIRPFAIRNALGLHRNTVSRRLTGDSPFYAYELAVLAVLFNVPPVRLLDNVVEVEHAPDTDPGSAGAADTLSIEPLTDPA